MTATPAPPAGAPAGLLALLDRLEARLAQNRELEAEGIAYTVELRSTELAALLTAARRGAETATSSHAQSCPAHPAYPHKCLCFFIRDHSEVEAMDRWRAANDPAPITHEVSNMPATLADINAIAAVCHDANRRWCIANGDLSQPAWEEAPAWQRESALLGVKGIAEGTITRPEQSHESWSAQKLAEGWVYGPVKDPEAKTHHCLVPFDQLPPEQQAKDRLFYAVATALLPAPTP